MNYCKGFHLKEWHRKTAVMCSKYYKLWCHKSLNCTSIWHVHYVQFITSTMLASTGISCRRVSVCLLVCPSVTSRCSTEMAKHRIMPTTPHDSPGTLVFWCRKLVTSDVKHCQLSLVASLSHWASTLFLCSTLQRIAQVCQQQLILVVMRVVLMHYSFITWYQCVLNCWIVCIVLTALIKLHVALNFQYIIL